MTKIHNRLWIGDQSDCTNNSFVIVHACKFPCHKKAVGYSGNPDRNGEYYLYKRDGRHLYLNLIDPPMPKPVFQIESFRVALDFIEEFWNKDETILIHCNKGLSRSPSLALLFMTKRLKLVPDSSYKEAYRAFNQRYHRYVPSVGISQFLGDNWNNIS